AKQHGPLAPFSGLPPPLPLHARFCSGAAPWRGSNHCAAADACPAPAEQSVAHSCPAATRCRPGTDREKAFPSSKNGTDDEKRAAVAGGSKSKQGGVKQRRQERLNVHRMDAPTRGRDIVRRS